MLIEILRVQFIISISYVLLRFTRDFKDTFLKNQFYFFKYDILDRLFICMFFILTTYNILLIYCTAKALFRLLTNKKKNESIKINFDNHFILVLPSDINKLTTDTSNCSICLDDFNQENNNQVCKLIQCSHYYHLNCIKEWYIYQYNNLQITSNNSNYLEQLSCPMCRAYKTD